MASGDLSSDLSLGILAPATSVRRAEGHPAGTHDRTPRRKPRQQPDSDESPEPVEAPEHQLDRLA
jgi:hypothetical protein